MRQQIESIRKRNIMRMTLGSCVLTLFLSSFNGEKAWGDNTFIINFVVSDDKVSGGTTTEQITGKGAKIVEKTIVLPSQQINPQQVTVSHPQAPRPQIMPQPQAPTAEKLQAPKKVPTQQVAVKANPLIQPSAEKQKPTSLVPVQARPKAVPVHENTEATAESKELTTSPGATVSYSDAANGRSPLGSITSNQEVHNQRWYLYAAATRGLRDFPASVQVVSVAGKDPRRGEEVKDLLVKMGIEPTKVKLIHATGEATQAGDIYIFAGN